MILLTEVRHYFILKGLIVYKFLNTKYFWFDFIGEVEEQLSLLLELVPEWISEKLASSGDLLMWYVSLF